MNTAAAPTGHVTVSPRTLPRNQQGLSYPFHSFEVALQQTVQREGDDVVHILNLKNKNREYSHSVSILS